MVGWVWLVRVARRLEDGGEEEGDSIAQSAGLELTATRQPGPHLHYLPTDKSSLAPARALSAQPDQREERT